jgi:hypothetical protein
MIPKIIHYCWFGNHPIPMNLQRCIDSWKKIMPDYEIIRWDESNYDVTKCAYMKEAYEAKKWAFVPDYARLDICYTYGGIYLDTDIETIKPFDDLLSLEGFGGMELKKRDTVGGVNVGLALGLGFGLAQGQMMGKIMRDDYQSLHFNKEDGSYDLTPSPVIQTQSLLKYGLKHVNEVQDINGFAVFPTEYFCPMNQFTGELKITPNTHSIHYYAASWYPPADQERRRLRQEYSKKYGSIGSEVLSSLVAYKKHYGIFGMWNQLIKKIIK